MTGHLVVPALDPHLPASLSRAIQTSLLRDELGFTGLVITDGIEMRAASARYGMAGATVLALAAGADTICVGGEHADEATATRPRRDFGYGAGVTVPATSTTVLRTDNVMLRRAGHARQNSSS